MSSQFEIREYREFDWARVCQVHDRARPIELKCIVGFTQGHPFRTLAEAANEDGFFRSRTAVIHVDSQLIGFASADGACLTFLYVDPNFHRLGAGRALLSYVIPWMGSEGYTTVAAANAPAIALYQSIGMELACRFPGEAEGEICECLRFAFPTSSHRRRQGRPSLKALRLEAIRLAVPVETLPREWPVEPS